jgi:hypothetical protein
MVVQIPRAMTIRLSIVDILGREIDILYEGAVAAGTHRFSWDAANYGSGVYVAQLNTDGAFRSVKMVLMK